MDGLPEDVVVVLSTFPNADAARDAGRALVEEKLAACANILPAIESIYRWEGRVETAGEVLAIFKTTLAGYGRLEQRLRALHPYEVPEIIALPVAAGAVSYLDWVRENTGR